MNKRLLFIFTLITAQMQLDARDITGLSSDAIKNSGSQTDTINVPYRRRHSKEGKRAPGGWAFWRKNRWTYKDMDFEELCEARARLIEKGDKVNCVKYTERALKLCNDINQTAELLIELADLLFDIGKFNKAEIVYNRFVTLYPGNEHIEYALYKNILCTYYGTRPADRDQTKTEETIGLTDKFLERELFDTYRKEVHTIRDQCFARLFESECNVCLFYANRNRTHAVDKRLHHLDEKIVQRAPELKPRFIAFEMDIAALQGNQDRLDEKRAILKAEYPEYDALITAENERKSHNLTHRF